MCTYSSNHYIIVITYILNTVTLYNLTGLQEHTLLSKMSLQTQCLLTLTSGCYKCNKFTKFIWRRHPSQNRSGLSNYNVLSNQCVANVHTVQCPRACKPPKCKAIT